MIGAILGIFLVVVLAIIGIFMFGIFRALPFMTGLLGSLVLLLAFPGLKDIIPGETTPSVITIIVGIEIVIAILTFNQHTGGPMIKFSCIMFVSLIVGLSYDMFECASWQKALFVTVIYLIVMGIITASNLDSLGYDSDTDRNLLASIIVSLMYAASVGSALLVILGAIWGQYVERSFSKEFYNTYDNAGLVIIAVIMAVTAIGSIVRDRLELA